MNKLLSIRLGDCAIDFTMDLDEWFPSDRATLDWTDLCGACEPEVIYTAYRVLRAGDTAIDGGANTGYVSLIMAALVGRSGKVLSFEPDFDNFAKLQANIRLNDAFQILVCDRPLWSKQEKVTLHLSPRDSGAHSLAPLGLDIQKTQPMLGVAIDSLDCKPKLIKLDIEGAEVEALRGAQHTITKHKPYVICEMNHGALKRFNETNSSLRGYAREAFGYDTWLLLRTHAFPVFVPPTVELVTPVDNTNILFATAEMVAAAFPQIFYQLPQNVLDYLRRANA